jgi:hypothetical protein
MFFKAVFVLLLCASTTEAVFLACINQSGFELGVGNTTVDGILKGNFAYMAMDNNYKAYAVDIGLDIERKIVAFPQFKLYGMCGVFFEYSRVSLSYLSAMQSGEGERGVFGFDIIALRPEAIITPNISVYMNIALVKYELGTEIGTSVWIIGLPSNSLLSSGSALPQIGLKFYF